MTDDICEVIITAPDPDWLADFTRELVNARLAACGHNIAQIRSIYGWRGDVHDEPEARVALHTRLGLVPEIVSLTRERHPYEVPCVIAMPIVGSNPDYIQWVRAETAR